MTRKVLLCSVILFIYPDSMTQITSAIAVCTAFFCLQLKYRPFLNSHDNNLQTLALGATLYTMWGASVMYTGNVSEGGKSECGLKCGTGLVVANVIVLVYAGWLLIYKTLPGLVQRGKDRLFTMWRKMQRQAKRGATKMRSLKERLRSRGNVSAPQTPKATDQEDQEQDLSGDIETRFDTGGMAEPKTAGGDEDESTEDSIIASLFERYDLDESGTINSNDELKQLCFNLCFQLQLQGGGSVVGVVDDAMGTVDLSDENAFTLPEFKVWFQQHVCEVLAMQEDD